MRAGKAPACIAKGSANGFGAQIQAQQHAAFWQSIAKVDGIIADQSAGSALSSAGFGAVGPFTLALTRRTTSACVLAQNSG